MKFQIIFGTRPEAIKLYPVIEALKATTGAEVDVVLTGQHREMVDNFCRETNLTADVNLNAMQETPSLDGLSSRLMASLPAEFERFKPDTVIVQGDTLSAFSSTLCAYHHHIPVAHVEAGLRSNNLKEPWPEEGYRQMIARLASVHFAPTEEAKSHLLDERIDPSLVHVTGNTVIDALHIFSEQQL